jgi:hypothetical protein
VHLEKHLLRRILGGGALAEQMKDQPVHTVEVALEEGSERLRIPGAHPLQLRARGRRGPSLRTLGVPAPPSAAAGDAAAPAFPE